jgi:hypothetical protein
MAKHKEFNHDVAKSLKRDEFIAQHEPNEAYDYGLVWDEINEKKTENKTPKPAVDK